MFYFNFFFFSLGEFVYMKVLPSPAKLAHPPRGSLLLANYSAYSPFPSSQHALPYRVRDIVR